MNWGLRPASASVRSVASNSFQKRLVQLGRIWMHWDDIVGAELAKLCQPAGIKSKSFIKTKEGKTIPVEFELQIAAEAAQSINITYKQDLILARIHQILGNEGVKSLKIVPPSRDNAPKELHIKAASHLTTAEKSFLSESLDGITDPELKERLERVGIAILQKMRVKSSTRHR